MPSNIVNINKTRFSQLFFVKPHGCVELCKTRFSQLFFVKPHGCVELCKSSVQVDCLLGLFLHRHMSEAL